MCQLCLSLLQVLYFKYHFDMYSIFLGHLSAVHLFFSRYFSLIIVMYPFNLSIFLRHITSNLVCVSFSVYSCIPSLYFEHLS